MRSFAMLFGLFADGSVLLRNGLSSLHEKQICSGTTTRSASITDLSSKTHPLVVCKGR